MQPAVFRAVYAVASISGAGLAGVVKEHDPRVRMHLLQTVRACIPALLQQADSPGPVAFLAKSMLDLATSRQTEDAGTRLAALDTLSELFRHLGEGSRAFLAGTVCALVKVALGWATDSKAVVVRAVRVLCTVIIEAGIRGDSEEDGETAGRVVVALLRLQNVRVDEVADELAVLAHSSVPCRDIQMAAMDTFITIAPMEHAVREVKFGVELSEQKYCKTPTQCLRQLVFVAMRLPTAAAADHQCIFDSLFAAVTTDYHLNIKQPVVVAFDEVHLEDASLFEESFARAGRVKPGLSDLPFAQTCRGDCGGDCGVLAAALGVLSGEGPRFLDLIGEARLKGSLLEAIKLAALYVSLPRVDVDAACEVLVDLDETVLSTGNERMSSVWLQVVHLFCYHHRGQFDFCQTGALLTLLLPKLFSASHVHRQCAVRCLAQLVGRADSLKERVLGYQEFLLDSAMQQLSSAGLFPGGPRLVAALLVLLLPASVRFLEPFVLKAEELLDSRAPLGPHYTADLVECLVQGVKVCQRGDDVAVRKAVCTEAQLTGEAGDDRAQSHSLCERIVNRIFTAAVNLLSSEHELVRKRVCELVEQCCVFYGKGDRDSFLPLLHKAWQRLVQRCDDRDPRVAKVACDALIVLIRFDGGFVKSRLSLDWIRRINNVHFVTALITSHVDMDLRTIEYLIDKFGLQIRDALAQSALFADIAWFHYAVTPGP